MRNACYRGKTYVRIIYMKRLPVHKSPAWEVPDARGLGPAASSGCLPTSRRRRRPSVLSLVIMRMIGILNPKPVDFPAVQTIVSIEGFN